MRTVDKKMLINDLNNFKTMQIKALELGVPYKRGYLFYGTPGCGKTSAVHAIARETEMDLYVIDIKDMSVQDYENALDQVPPHSILLFDDIDTNKITWSRREIQDDSSDHDNVDVIKALAMSVEKKVDGVSSFRHKTALDISNLLRSLDGYENLNGCIVIMNTNHPEKLDNALIREGRIDVKIEFKFCDRDQLRHIAEAVFDETTADSLLHGVDFDSFESHEFSVSKVLVGWMLPNSGCWEKAREVLLSNISKETQ
ncbi:hypothetical protein AKO1_006705 [Acrasis kona]|uniref:AAA+ ATPase domain-containing protein n=1 Tax=Acrasis kona TaxID=1008807 RepID=A0AAW2ZKY9_9EUKA